MKKFKIKKHTGKRMLAMLMAMVMIICAIPTIGVTASAASTTAFDVLSSSKYAKTYVLATAGKTIPYTSSNLSTRGTVSYGANKNSYIDNKADEIRILDVGKNSKGVYWALVSYPSGSKRVNAYIELSAITPNNGSHVKVVSSGKFNCAPRRDAAISGSYYVSKGDTVYLVASYGSRYQILYPSGSVWRLAWCNASDYNKYCPSNTANSMVDVTRSFNGKKVILQSVQNGKYLCADGNLSNTPAVCNRSTASTSSSSWEVFTVKVTSDGWAGFRAHNGKWLTARVDITNSPIRATASNLYSWECFRIYQKGNDYYIKSQANNKWLCVRVDMSNAPVQAYASTPSTWERFSISIVNAATTTTSSNNEAAVRARLDSIANGTLKYDSKTVMAVNRTFTGTRSSEQCKGYAKNVFYLCFKITPGSTLSKSAGKNYLISDTSGMKKVGSVTGMTNCESSRNAIKALFLSARPGDFVQMRRQHTGSHSAIVYSVTNTGVTFLEANTDGKNTVKLITHTWDALCQKNMAMSVYTATDYKLK